MSRFNGSATLIRKGRTVPGWELGLSRFNNLCAKWPSGAGVEAHYRGTMGDLHAVSTVSLDLTISLWIKIPEGTSSNRGVFVLNSNSGGQAIFGMYWDSTVGRIRVSYGSAAIRHDIEADMPADGKWHLVVWSSNTNSNLTYLRVDNGSIITSAATGSPCAPQGGLTNPFVIGYYNHPMLAHQYSLDGVALDEFSSFSVGITSILDFDKLYNNGLQPDINEQGYWLNGASLNSNNCTKWFRWDFDPNNSRSYSSGLVNSATGTGSITATTLIHSSQLTGIVGYPITTAVFPEADKDTTHRTQPDYAALAAAWGDWSKGLTYPSYGSRFALATGVEVRNSAPGLMPESLSGWGYYLQNSWITLNTQEPFSTPTLETSVIGTGLFDDSLPSFNNDLQATVDGRTLNRRDGLFAKKV